MSLRHGLLLAVLLAGGCADAEPFAADPEAAAPRLATWGVDADQDGIDDGTEWELASRHAPLFYMPNLITRAQAEYAAGDWTWPATVEWYLPRVRMRIHHNNCSDHQLLDLGQVNATNLLQQAHKRYKLGIFGCSHDTPYQYSNSSFHPDDHYFLQATNDDAVHPGVLDPSQWKLYFHAYPNTMGGVTLQYWIFYAYNDGFSIQNHEGDWENVDVRLDAAGNPQAVILSFHGIMNQYAPADLSWHGTHPRVWVADGSHANFRSEDACNSTMREAGMMLFGIVVERSCWTNDAQRWFTWTGGRGTAAGLQGAGLVNLGAKRAPASGQQWIQYSARWGEVGQSPDTSGPQGPAYKSHWFAGATSAYVTGGSTGGTGGTGGGGTGGGGDDCSGGDGDVTLQTIVQPCEPY
jgi:hypothetical protein